MKNKILRIIGIGIIAIGGVVVFADRGAETGRSYVFVSETPGKIYQVKNPNTYAFSITDDRGKTVKDFTITHTKPMHVIVVRKDLEYFQHVHPEFNSATGAFVLQDLVFPTDGPYRIFADFAVEQESITISEDIQVGSLAQYSAQNIGSEGRVKIVDGYQVVLGTSGVVTADTDATLTFSLSQNGKPLTDLEPYLGALGHTVILREGTLDFIHAHPVEKAGQDGTVQFEVNFPEAGTYKAFTQFQRGGNIATSDFVVTVLPGSNTLVPGPPMDHSAH